MLNKSCTFFGCMSPAAFTEPDKQGNPWCYLCAVHHNILVEALASGDAKAILSTWVKAQGGAKAAAARM